MLSKRRKNEVIENKQVGVKLLKELLMSFINEYPVDADELVSIFSDAEQLFMAIPEKVFIKATKRQNVESMMLNVLHNCAMTKINPQDAIDFMLKNDSVAFNLFNRVNKIKLDKGYISKTEFRENETLAVKLSLQAPMGNW